MDLDNTREIQNKYVELIKKENPVFFGCIHLNCELYSKILDDGLKFVRSYIHLIGRQFEGKHRYFIRASIEQGPGPHFHFVISLPDNPLAIPKLKAKLIRSIPKFEHQEFAMSAGHTFWRDFKARRGEFARADCHIRYFKQEKNGPEYVVRNSNDPSKYESLDTSAWGGNAYFTYDSDIPWQDEE